MRLDKKKCCIFCGRYASTMDHIPSKNLLEKPYPNNLLTVPACDICNKSFSMDEEYLLNVLVEITNNPVLLKKKNINGNIYKARQRSIGLRERIRKSFVTGDDGRIYISPEMDRINRVMEKNALGLYHKKYNLLFNINSFRCIGLYPYNVDEGRPSDVFMLTYKSNFRPKRWTIVQDDVFSYIVVRDWRRNNKLTMIFNIHYTIWCAIEVPYPHYRKRKGNSLIRQLRLF